MRIGITGGTGLIGQAWLNYNSKTNRQKILCLVRKPVAESADTPTIQWSQGDLLSYSDCVEFVNQIDTLVHLASATLPLTSGRSLAADFSVNLLPTLNLIQAIRECGRPFHLVYPSSGGQIYGCSESLIPWKETDDCKPVSAYGVHKLAAEHYLRLLAQDGTVSCTVLRIGNVYGAPLPPERLQGFLGTAAHELKKGRPVRLIGSTTNIRDYIHLEDVCSALDWALVRLRSGFQIFNVGSGRGHSIDQLLALLRQRWPDPLQLTSVPSYNRNRSLIPWSILDVSCAKTAGWQPHVAIEEGIDRLLRSSA